MDDIITLHKETGAKVCIGTSSGGDLTTASLTEKILKTRKLAEAGALLAFEGPNEPNNWSVVYNGVTGGSSGTWSPIADLMRDVYKRRGFIFDSQRRRCAEKVSSVSY